jgi:DNA-binding transcriptional LysR family regulator
LVERYLELEKRVKAYAGEESVAGSVGVAAIYSGLNYMSQFVKMFEQRYPQVSVRLEYLHPDRVVERVSSSEAELGLLSCPRRWSELNVINWREESMVLTVYPSHRLAHRVSVSIAELEGEDFIAFDPELPIRRIVDRFLKHHSVQVEVVLEFDNIENIKHAVRLVSGISILPEPSLVQDLQLGTLVAIPIAGRDSTDRLTRPLAIIHRRHANLDVAAAKFLELLLSSDVSFEVATTAEPSDRVPTATSP